MEGEKGAWVSRSTASVAPGFWLFYTLASLVRFLWNQMLLGPENSLQISNWVHFAVTKDIKRGGISPSSCNPTVAELRLDLSRWVIFYSIIWTFLSNVYTLWLSTHCDLTPSKQEKKNMMRIWGRQWCFGETRRLLSVLKPLNQTHYVHEEFCFDHIKMLIKYARFSISKNKKQG